MPSLSICSAGDPLSSAGLTDTGGGNGAFDNLTIIGSTGSDAITASTGQLVNFNGTPVNSSNVRQVIFTQERVLIHCRSLPVTSYSHLQPAQLPLRR